MNRRAPDVGLRLVGKDAVAAGLNKRRRWRLWDLHRGIHGALLALSFAEDDLHRLLRKAGVTVPTEARYYDIHRHFCEACTSRNTLSELVEKALEQKFATKVIALRNVRDGEALAEKWREAWAKGRGLPALFWAFLAHPVATDEIRAAFYADVHGLFYRTLSERERLLDDLDIREHKLRALEKRRREDASTFEARIEKLLSKAVAEEPAAQATSHHELRRRAELAEIRATRAEARIRSLEERLAVLRAKASAMTAEAASSSCPATSLPIDAPSAAPKDSNVAVITRIPGVRIAYVGGRPGVVERIEEFCTMRGATFAHHDGGLEESPARLDQILTGADVIFYPVDCISHEAVLHVKAHCKRSETPAIPLRNASISTFRGAIRAWCGLT